MHFSLISFEVIIQSKKSVVEMGRNSTIIIIMLETHLFIPEIFKLRVGQCEERQRRFDLMVFNIRENLRQQH